MVGEKRLDKKLAGIKIRVENPNSVIEKQNRRSGFILDFKLPCQSLIKQHSDIICCQIGVRINAGNHCSVISALGFPSPIDCLSSCFGGRSAFRRGSFGYFVIGVALLKKMRYFVGSELRPVNLNGRTDGE